MKDSGQISSRTMEDVPPSPLPGVQDARQQYWRISETENGLDASAAHMIRPRRSGPRRYHGRRDEDTLRVAEDCIHCAPRSDMCMWPSHTAGSGMSRGGRPRRRGRKSGGIASRPGSCASKRDVAFASVGTCTLADRIFAGRDSRRYVTRFRDHGEAFV